MRISKNVKRLLLPFLVVVMVSAGILVFYHVLTPATISDSFNYTIGQIEEAGENVDIVFIGGSRTYRSFDPKYFEEALDLENGMNLGSPAQRSKMGYYLLKDMSERFDLKYAVFGVTYNGMLYEQASHTAALVAERMTLKNRFLCAVDHFGLANGLAFLTGKSEYSRNLNIEDMVSNVEHKKTRRSGGGREDHLKGYFGQNSGLKPGGISFSWIKKDKPFELDDMLDESIEYLDKSVELCEKKGIKVIFASAPCSLANVYRVENYQDAVDYYTEYAEEHGFKYYNFNYWKGREEVFTDDTSKDYIHTNLEGGQRFSKLLAMVLAEEEEGKDTSHYFYKDIDEMKKDIHRIPGISFDGYVTGDDFNLKMLAFHNDDMVPEFRVLISKSPDKNNTDYKVIRDWSTDDTFSMPVSEAEKYGTIRVEARCNEPGEIIAYRAVELSKFIKQDEN